MDNRTIYQRLINTWNSGDFSDTNEWLETDYISHDSPSGGGIENFKQAVTWFRAAFPDFVFKIEFMVSEDDRLVGYWTGGGTHKGEILGMLPTDKSITCRGFDCIRTAEEKVVEVWHCEDWQSLVQQIGNSNPVT